MVGRISQCMVVGLFFVLKAEAVTLVNDFSGPVSGYVFTENLNEFYGSGGPSASPNALGVAGQVDKGFYTVNFRDTDPFTVGSNGIVNAYTGDMGGWDPATGLYGGGTYFDLQGITGFLVSLRRETANTAATINLYILTNQDFEYWFPISTSSLSTSSFIDIFVNLSSNPSYNYFSGLTAAQIGVRGDSSIPSSTYNFSIDSLRAVPEPSSGLLLFSGLGALGLLRRRAR